jgi:hypothetical protein
MSQSFSLQPFTRDLQLPQLAIDGQIDRRGNIFSIAYNLRGDLDTVVLPPPLVTPSRKFELWEATCFELFLGVPGEPNYWEVNLAPTGDWNIFALDGYRQGLRNELAFASMPMVIDRQLNSFQLGLELDLSQIISSTQPIEVAITTVIQPRQGELSYWAITHCGKVADFHLRDSFTMLMPLA